YDGTEIANLTDFLDYRIVNTIYPYEEVGDGQHTIEISATDTDGNTTSESVSFEKVPPYTPKYRGEALYMPFDGDFMDLISVSFPAQVGSPGFAGEAHAGSDAYAGAENSYLSFPAENFVGDEFSASFWMKIADPPGRAGIIVASPPDPANPSAGNNRNSGFRFFREDPRSPMQTFKLNVGTGDGEAWFDGGEAADVMPNTGEWVHFAFSIEAGYATVYINGAVVSEGEFAGIDWTNIENISIMSGEPNWTGWDHFADLSYLDELRFFTVALTQAEVQQILTDEGGSVSPGTEFEEIFYMPFDGDYTEVASGGAATEIGTPGFAGEAKDGSDAYAGAADSYLTFPSEGLENNEFSATFWYKVNDEPDRAGILVIGPPDPDNPETANIRTSGFRFFRENPRSPMQTFKLNVGTGDGEAWFDGGEAADIDPATGEWVHLAFTISETEAKVYIDGVVVSEGEFAGIDWTDCDVMSIMSGTPNFVGWEHYSDLSYMDELRIFDRALTQEEIDEIINSDAK
ncbi:MAG: LamG domain-containing protein, partial [Bacteroidales bacterium]